MLGSTTGFLRRAAGSELILLSRLTYTIMSSSTLQFFFHPNLDMAPSIYSNVRRRVALEKAWLAFFDPAEFRFLGLLPGSCFLQKLKGWLELASHWIDWMSLGNLSNAIATRNSAEPRWSIMEGDSTYHCGRIVQVYSMEGLGAWLDPFVL